MKNGCLRVQRTCSFAFTNFSSNFSVRLIVVCWNKCKGNIIFQQKISPALSASEMH
uniref:Uncharacterized protein n=1 Tax=Triticum urartu TaxID=4572 RepID=A0A8R7Q5X2_TRIUA